MPHHRHPNHWLIHLKHPRLGARQSHVATRGAGVQRIAALAIAVVVADQRRLLSNFPRPYTWEGVAPTQVCRLRMCDKGRALMLWPALR